MRSKLVAVLAAAAVAAACSDSSRPPTAPESISVPVHFEADAHAGGRGGVPHNHRTHLTGDEEVPPVDTQAQGQAIFQVSRDGTSASYKLIVANIENVTQAHIHCCAPVGANAGVAVWLYPSGPPAQLIPGRTQGVLAEGVITAANFVGPLAGQLFSRLLDEIRLGRTYVNVHTSQFPGGEIRGQID